MKHANKVSIKLVYARLLNHSFCFSLSRFPSIFFFFFLATIKNDAHDDCTFRIEIRHTRTVFDGFFHTAAPVDDEKKRQKKCDLWCCRLEKLSNILWPQRERAREHIQSTKLLRTLSYAQSNLDDQVENSFRQTCVGCEKSQKKKRKVSAVAFDLRMFTYEREKKMKICRTQKKIHSTRLMALVALLWHQ